jgi:5'(3')-deoxyribonucleotidase
MKKLRIAIDFDDTIAQTFEDGFLPALNKWQVTNTPFVPHKWTIEDFTTWDAAGETSLPQGVIDNLFTNVDWSKVGQVPEAMEVIQTLIDDGHYIQVVTANPNEEDVRDWMNCNGLSNVPMTSFPDKVAYVVRREFDLLIDDNAATCKDAWDAGLDVIIFDRPWNRELLLLRRSNWSAIYERIEIHSRFRSVDQQLWDQIEATPEMDMGYDIGEGIQDAIEEVIVNANGAKQTDLKARYDLLPARAVAEVARVLKRGADKYGEENWRGLSVPECHNHTLGHAVAFNESGELEDLAHTACRALMALEIFLNE